MKVSHASISIGIAAGAILGAASWSSKQRKMQEATLANLERERDEANARAREISEHLKQLQDSDVTRDPRHLSLPIEDEIPVNYNPEEEEGYEEYFVDSDFELFDFDGIVARYDMDDDDFDLDEIFDKHIEQHPVAQRRLRELKKEEEKEEEKAEIVYPDAGCPAHPDLLSFFQVKNLLAFRKFSSYCTTFGYGLGFHPYAYFGSLDATKLQKIKSECKYGLLNYPKLLPTPFYHKYRFLPYSISNLRLSSSVIANGFLNTFNNVRCFTPKEVIVAQSLRLALQANFLQKKLLLQGKFPTPAPPTPPT